MTTDDEVLELDSVSLDDNIEKRFTYHPPKHAQPERYQLIRDNAKKLAYIIKHNTPPSEEQSIAIVKLQAVVMWANCAIALNE